MLIWRFVLSLGYGQLPLLNLLDILYCTLHRWPCIPIVMAIGRSRIIFESEDYIKVPIAAESTLFTELRYLAVQEKYCNLNFQAFICTFCKISWKVTSKINYLELENQYYMPLSHNISQKYKEQLNFQDLRDIRSLITLI